MGQLFFICNSYIKSQNPSIHLSRVLNHAKKRDEWTNGHMDRRSWGHNDLEKKLLSEAICFPLRTCEITESGDFLSREF